MSLLSVSDRIDRLLARIASAAGWLLVALTALTCFDVAARKLGLPVPFTKLQEMEWHLHTAVFALWLGYNYTINAHPRVDSYVADFSQRRRAWIELAGCLGFALPYLLAVLYFGWGFVEDSFRFNEHSEAANGLPYRWIVKAVLYVGLVLVVVAVVGVMLRLLAFLVGGRTAEEAGIKLGPAVSEV